MAIGLLGKKNKEINRVVMIPVDEILSNPNQPRTNFEQADLEDLSRSIIANGLLQPITVRKKADGYELIAGERRTRAFKTLGREYIPAIIMEFDDRQSAVLALVENLQRKDLNYFEESVGIMKLMQQMSLTQQQVSEYLGKAQSTIANKLRLLRYPADLQQKMLKAGLTERHARALLRIKNDDLLRETVDFIIERDYNVERTEQYVESQIQSQNITEKARLFVIKDMRLFHNSIMKAIDMMSRAGIHIENHKREDDSFIEYTIKIPKFEVYKIKQNAK